LTLTIIIRRHLCDEERKLFGHVAAHEVLLGVIGVAVGVSENATTILPDATKARKGRSGQNSAQRLAPRPSQHATWRENGWDIETTPWRVLPTNDEPIHVTITAFETTPTHFVALAK
jgi:hypothetical protein